VAPLILATALWLCLPRVSSPFMSADFDLSAAEFMQLPNRTLLHEIQNSQQME